MGSTKSFFIALLLLLSGASLSAQNNLSKAEKQYELGAYNLALETYKDVLKSYNGNLKALVGAGDCHRLLNQMDAARQMYERAIIHDDVEPIVYEKLGKVMMSLRQYDEAKKYFVRYTKLVNTESTYPYPTACDIAMNTSRGGSEYEVSLVFDNTAGTEFSPTFFKDHLIFASSRSSKRSAYNKRSNAGFSDNAKTKLFRSDINSFGNIEQTKTLRADWDKTLSEGPLSYSETKNWVVFTKNNFIDGTRQIPESKLELSMYFAEVDANGVWTKNVPFEHNGPGYSTGYGVFSEDGNTLVFASDRQDNSFGGFDLFVSFYQNGSWSKPVNLGAKVNTPGDELSPFILENKLYFSSNYHPGFGGMDVFVSEKDGNGYYSNPVNLGKGINSSRDDNGFIYDPYRNLGFLSSNRLGGKGNEDIYSFRKNQDHLMVKVIDAQSQNPIAGVQVDLSACGGVVATTDDQGRFSYSLLKEGACTAIISKANYAAQTINISNFGSSSSKEILVNLVSLSDSYEYLVYEKESNKAVASALVHVTSSATGKTFESYTDEKGRVVLPLVTNENYMVTIRAQGFTSTSKRILIKQGVNPAYVQGTFYLESSLPSIEEELSNEAPIATYESKSDNVRPKGTYPVYGFSSAYYIQLGAFKGGDKVNLEAYQSKLNAIGPVVIVREDDRQKVRLGPFASKAEASSNLGAVSSAGYRDAFVFVGKQTLELEESDQSLTAKGPEMKEYGNSDEVITFEWAPKEQTKAITEGTIFIQLCAVSKASSLDDPKFNVLKSIGNLSNGTKGNFKTKLLGPFEDNTAASKALKQVKAKGFKDAFIVK